VGAFRLLSGAGASAKGGLTVGSAGGGGSASREEKVMREAGNPDACAADGDGAPRNCASPIQLFLQPVAPPGATVSTAGTAATAGAATPAAVAPVNLATAVEVAFPDIKDHHWSLHDMNGTILCDVPCTRAVPPGSGWFLEREGGGHVKIDLPARLPYSPGTHVVADYQGERGAPLLSTLTFYGLGIPAALGGAACIGLGAAGTGNDAGSNLSGFWYGSSVMYFAIAAAATWWYFWSHPSSFDTHAQQ
jgi:hypothetical protein